MKVDPAFRSHRKFGGKRMNKVPGPTMCSRQA
ncbi:hypothetical protein OKW42_001290 [Paraburkholderia sp. WC7.3d]